MYLSEAFALLLPLLIEAFPAPVEHRSTPEIPSTRWANRSLYERQEQRR
jgi:hypothetical protein